MWNPITNNIIRRAKVSGKCKDRNKFKDRLEILEKNLQDSNYTEYLQLKGEWEGIHQQKNNGILVRAKALWIEEGEKNTKYFLNLEKRNYNTKNTKTLITKDGNELKDLKEIIEEEKSF